MLEKFLLLSLLVFLPSCATGKKITVINDDKNYQNYSGQVSALVEQVFDYYQKSPGSNACIPHPQYARDPQVESDFRDVKKIRVTDVFQYNKYYADIAFLIYSRKDPVFLRVALREGKCDSFILEDFKLYDKH